MIHQLKMPLKIYTIAVVSLSLLSTTPNCFGYTEPSDVEAISKFYKALDYPPLKGWVRTDGDPCALGWQGVQCDSNKIVGIILNNLGIRGQVGVELGMFSSLEICDLSHNYMWGNIPLNLPPTLKILLLNDNNICGGLTDSFYQLKDLTYMNLTKNCLGSPLPASMVNLTSLSTFHIKDNYMTGSLDLLHNSPLIDLDIDHNFFCGPIPPNLWSIPSFSHEGCNLTFPSSAFKSSSYKVEWLGILILVLLALGFCMFVSRSGKQKSIIEVVDHIKKYMLNVCSSYQFHQKEKEVPMNDNGRNDPIPRTNVGQEKMEAISKNPPVPPLLPLPLNEIVIKPEPALLPVPVPNATTGPNISIITDLPRSFPISSLQQYTNSFSQENLLCRGLLGAVYKAQLPDRKLLAVKKLENADSSQWSDKDFMDLVSNVSKLQNENIVGLVGYCCEQGEQIFVYEHCKNGTLFEALHLDGDMHKALSWKTRLNMTLQAARALEYLHEAHIVHQNFKSANILLDEELNAHVFDCGLAPMIPLSYKSQFQASGYGAPELESGSHAYQSDVYSFGVVMLELLTGRKAHHRSKSHGEQYLVKWAFPKLHDIDALTRMVDPSLNAAYSSKSLSRFADIIFLCLQDKPEFRPPMSEIVQYFEHMTRMKH